MTEEEVRFEGIFFPKQILSPEMLQEVREEFTFKEEDVLILTFPKSGKEAGSDIETGCGYDTPSLHRQMQCFPDAGNALGGGGLLQRVASGAGGAVGGGECPPGHDETCSVSGRLGCRPSPAPHGGLSIWPFVTAAVQVTAVAWI